MSGYEWGAWAAFAAAALLLGRGLVAWRNGSVRHAEWGLVIALACAELGLWLVLRGHGVV